MRQDPHSVGFSFVARLATGVGVTPSRAKVCDKNILCDEQSENGRMSYLIIISSFVCRCLTCQIQKVKRFAERRSS